jgi:hypothetical protein
LQPLEWLLLHSPLMVWAPLASNLYHDFLWYPIIGQKSIRAFMQTEWGELFARYAPSHMHPARSDTSLQM